jgi:hypothetical protein
VVTGTGGSNLNVRESPDADAAMVGALAEGTVVQGGEHAWRRIEAKGGVTGWVADAFLTPE